MLIDLGIPANKNQREFSDALNAALRARISSSHGSAGFDQDGNFVTEIRGLFSLSAGNIELSWKLIKSTDGVLQSVEIETVADEPPEVPWQQEVNQLVTSVLTSILTDNRSTYFQRSLLFYVGPQLDGEYWLPGFRFAPAWPEDPEPHLLNAERVVVLDQDIPALDDMHAHSVADEVARRTSARLSLLLNTGLHRPHGTNCWVMELNETENSLKSVRRQRGYSDPRVNVTAMPRKKEFCELGSYSGDIRSNTIVAGQLLSLPGESRKILRGIDNAAPEITQAFDSAARLYQVGKVCGRDFPSVGLAYRVAAVEAMCQADKQYKNFSDFVRAHVEARSGLDVILNALYGKLRSSHFHSGTFPAGEFSRQGLFDPLMDDEHIRRMELDRACEEITREAMVNWIFARVPEVEAQRGRCADDNTLTPTR